MALSVSDKELAVCERLMLPAWIAAALQNHIFSWEKERDAAKKANSENIINAVWVLMVEHSIGEEEAMALCREDQGVRS